MNSNQLGTVSAQMRNITPELAAAFLETSNGNRCFKVAKVSAYARDMKNGRWQVNGEPIIIDATGALIDGHHRLTACIEAGVSFTTMLVSGVAPESQKTVDMGASRTIADVLSFYGFKNTNLISSIVRTLFSLEAGRFRSANPSAQEVFDFAKRHPEISEAANIATHKPLARCATLIGAIYFIAMKNGEVDTAKDFLATLSSGVPSWDGCPAHNFRERLLRAAIAGKPLPLRDLHFLFLTAWEKYRIGAEVKMLRPMSEYRATGWPA